MSAPKPYDRLSAKGESDVLREAEEGLKQTVAIYRQVGIPDMQIAMMFRGVADELERKIVVVGNDTVQ